MVIMVICCFGCAALFFGIGHWAERSEKPVHFWSGTKVEPSKVSDIPGYNHACAVMWKIYSIPYWCCGVLSGFGGVVPSFQAISAVLLSVACIPGSFWLIWQYTKIEKQYIIKE